MVDLGCVIRDCRAAERRLDELEAGTADEIPADEVLRRARAAIS